MGRGVWMHESGRPEAGRSQVTLAYAICRLWFFSGNVRMRWPVALK